jgi:hypothetical protein
MKKLELDHRQAKPQAIDVLEGYSTDFGHVLNIKQKASDTTIFQVRAKFKEGYSFFWLCNKSMNDFKNAVNSVEKGVRWKKIDNSKGWEGTTENTRYLLFENTSKVGTPILNVHIKDSKHLTREDVNSCLNKIMNLASKTITCPELLTKEIIIKSRSFMAHNL